MPRTGRFTGRARQHTRGPQRLEGDALLFNGHSISVQDKENVLEVDSDNDYTALRMCLMARVWVVAMLTVQPGGIGCVSRPSSGATHAMSVSGKGGSLWEVSRLAGLHANQ